MTTHDRLKRVLDRLSTATSVQRSRLADEQRAERNGQQSELEEAVVKLEEASDELWDALNSTRS